MPVATFPLIFPELSTPHTMENLTIVKKVYLTDLQSISDSGSISELAKFIPELKS